MGLIGWPVEHSISPSMHNAAFREMGIDWHYQLLPTPPERLESTLARLDEEGYRGVNVTVPHKQAVIPYLDRVADAVRGIGAVNTIVLSQGELVGHNTDGHGFLQALREGGLEPRGKRALVLGAGGAARAVVYSLAQAGCSVTLHNRTTERAQELAAQMRDLDIAAPVTTIDSVGEIADTDGGSSRLDLLVNATALGMAPATGRSPWPEEHPIPSHWTVFDLVYNPKETRLLAQARASGAQTISGSGMLVHQGALALELWTGQTPPVDVMRRAAERALAP